MGEEKITKKDIYTELWRGRDFEIQHLWQRSVFLGAFLVLFFTVYVSLFVAYGNSNESTANQSKKELTVYSGVYIVSSLEVEDTQVEESANSQLIQCGLFVTSLLGYVFSLLWIFMAKGSKYWYEKYEAGIARLQEDKTIFSDDINYEWQKEEAEARIEHREIEHIPIHGYLPYPHNQSMHFFSRKAGAYSLSKINILVGQVFWLFWGISMIYWLEKLFHCNNEWSFMNVIKIVIIIFLPIFLIIVISNLALSYEGKGRGFLASINICQSLGWKWKKTESFKLRKYVKWLSEMVFPKHADDIFGTKDKGDCKNLANRKGSNNDSTKEADHKKENNKDSNNTSGKTDNNTNPSDKSKIDYYSELMKKVKGKDASVAERYCEQEVCSIFFKDMDKLWKRKQRTLEIKDNTIKYSGNVVNAEKKNEEPYTSFFGYVIDPFDYDKGKMKEGKEDDWTLMIISLVQESIDEFEIFNYNCRSKSLSSTKYDGDGKEIDSGKWL